MQENEYQKELHKINCNYKIMKRFEGGMSNLTFLIEDQNGEEFVYRYPGLNNDVFVNYNTLENHLHLIGELDISNDLVYYNKENGLKISKYIKGKTIEEDVNLEDVSNCLKILHNSNVDMEIYNHLGRLEKYEKLCENKDEKYFNLKKEWLNIYETKLKQHVKYPAHGDSQFSNIVKTLDGKIKILDFEFSGINDYIYDIASFGNVNFEMAKKLLVSYEEEVKLEHLERLYAWRIFQCLQWHNVAKYKEQNGLSKQLNVDFNKVAKHYLDLASTLLKEYKKLHI